MSEPVFFDPWGPASADSPAPQPGIPEAEPASETLREETPAPLVTQRTALRWRSPAGAAPTPPSNARSTSATAKPRLPGTPGFLRSMAAPRLEDFAQRLQMARHDATVEDLLDERTPTLRLSLRPWRGPWTEELSPPRGMIVFSIEDGADEKVVVRVWLDQEAEEPVDEVRVAPTKVSGAWLDRLALDFVEQLLARA